MESPPDWAAEQFCYVTTTGRVSGRPHEIEIWFAVAPSGSTLFLLSGAAGASDWVRNMETDPAVSVRVGAAQFSARARFVEPGDEEQLARRLLTSRYQGWSEGEPMSEWGRTALVVALDL